MSEHKGWIGVDLDGTLAHYDGWKGIQHIGEPVPAMLARVKAWLATGQEVRIFTARVGPQREDVPDQLEIIEGLIHEWCVKHIGFALPVTCMKDFGMIALYDDRCEQVIPNQGITIREQWQQSLIIQEHEEDNIPPGA